MNASITLSVFVLRATTGSWKLLRLQGWVMACALFFCFYFFDFSDLHPEKQWRGITHYKYFFQKIKDWNEPNLQNSFFTPDFYSKNLVLPQGGFGKASLLGKGGGEGKTGGGTWKSPPFGCLKYLSAWKLNMMQLMNSNPPPSVLPSLSRDRCADSMAPSLKELSFMEADLSARHERLQAFGCSMYFKQNHHVLCQISRDNIRD